KESKDFPGLAEQGFSPAQKDAVLARLEKWRKDWMARDAAVYGSNYAGYFRDKEGRNRKAFLDRKQQIFESKQSITMTMEDAKIEPEGYGRVKVSFRQDYEAVGSDGAKQHSSDVKTLRLE